jgi:hypothetical protein
VLCIRHDQLITATFTPHPSSIISFFQQSMGVREIVCTLLGPQFGQTKNDDIAFGFK